MQARGRGEGRLGIDLSTLALRSLVPASLAGARLEVWCCGADVLAALLHCRADFVAV